MFWMYCAAFTSPFIARFRMFVANIVIVVRAILAVLTITRYFLLHEETLMLDAIDIELLIVRRYVVTAFPTSLFVVTE